MTLAWSSVAWSALDRDTLYAMIMLRERVFVVEQACAFQDADGVDPGALHLLGRDDAKLVAYARIFGPGALKELAVIGRVVVAPEARSGGLGRTLMREAIAATHTAFGPGAIWIGAQQRLERFYGALGFVVSGPSYDEDGILHVPMILPSMDQARPT